MNTKRGLTRDHLQHRRESSTHHSPTLPPHHGELLPLYAEQGCPTPNPDYSWTPNVSKAREKAEAAISSESDPDSYYSDRFDSAKAPDSTPPNAHMGTPTTQSVHSIEAPVGHFHVEHEALRKVEVQHPRHVCKPKTCRKEEASRPETNRHQRR
jgi:hypothetical protein